MVSAMVTQGGGAVPPPEVSALLVEIKPTGGVVHAEVEVQGYTLPPPPVQSARCY